MLMAYRRLMLPGATKARVISRTNGPRRHLATAVEVWKEINALGARPGAINMGQGFPDFAGSKVARESAAAALLSGDAALNQYSPPPGLQDLRDAVSEFYARTYPGGRPYDPSSEVVVCTSGQEALNASMRAVLQRTEAGGRNGVLVFEPFFPFTMPPLTNAGGVMQPVKLHAPTFAIDPAAVEAAITPQTGAIVLNTPHNPTGHVASRGELEAIAQLCVKHDLLAISDEVYEHSVFGAGCEHLRLADFPGMRERTITVSSAGKLFSLTGWRVAWALACPELALAVATAHTNLTYSAPTPLQAGIAAALKVEDGSFGGVRELFGGNFELLADALQCHGGLQVCDAQGGYFLVADTQGIPDMEYVRALADATGVVCTPMSVFYKSELQQPCTLVRFTICKSREHITRACKALQGAGAASVRTGP